MKEVVPWLDQEDVIEKYAWCLEYDISVEFSWWELVGNCRDVDVVVVVIKTSWTCRSATGREKVVIDRGSVTSPTNGRMASQILIQMQVWCLGISARKSATTSSPEG